MTNLSSSRVEMNPALAAAEVHVHAEWLNVTANDIGAVMARRGDDAQGNGIHAHNAQPAPRMSDGGDLMPLGFEEAQVGRILKIDGRRSLREFGRQVLEVHPPGHRIMADRDDAHHTAAVILHDLQAVGTDGVADEGFIPFCDPAGHPYRRAGRLAPVEGRNVDDVHVQELSHHAFVLEEGLESAVIFVGLTRIGRQEFGAAVDFIAHGGNVMGPAAAAEEAQRFGAGPVSARIFSTCRFSAASDVRRLGKVHPAARTCSRSGMSRVQLVDAPDTDLPAASVP